MLLYIAFYVKFIKRNKYLILGFKNTLYGVKFW